MEKGEGQTANSDHWGIEGNHQHWHWIDLKENRQSDKQCTKNLMDCVIATHIVLFCPIVKPVLLLQKAGQCVPILLVCLY